MSQSRLIPGYRILRVPRFGRGIPEALLSKLLDRLKREAHSGRTLRLHVELWSEDPSEVARARAVGESLGFTRTDLRSYRRTLWMDLRPEPEEIFAGLHSKGRFNVRKTLRKFPVEVRPIEDVRHVSALEALTEETMSRTKGRTRQMDWAAWIHLAGERPDLVRILGLFRTDVPPPSPLLAFAVGLHHGEVGEYGHAASTRATDLRAPLLYAPVWSLIMWAREQGASWFDLGGVTPEDDQGAFAGISSFKRYFSQDERVVGDELVYEPSPILGRFARVLGSTANAFRAT